TMERTRYRQAQIRRHTVHTAAQNRRITGRGKKRGLPSVRKANPGTGAAAPQIPLDKSLDTPIPVLPIELDQPAVIGILNLLGIEIYVRGTPCRMKPGTDRGHYVQRRAANRLHKSQLIQRGTVPHPVAQLRLRKVCALEKRIRP